MTAQTSAELADIRYDMYDVTSMKSSQTRGMWHMSVVTIHIYGHVIIIKPTTVAIIVSMVSTFSMGLVSALPTYAWLNVDTNFDQQLNRKGVFSATVI